MADSPKLAEIFRQLSIRMAQFRPCIDLASWVGSNLKLEDTTILDGVSFVATDWQAFMTRLRIAQTADGQKAFAEGRDPEQPAHWALDASMAATIGIGFREIYRPTLSSRPLSVHDLPAGHRSGWNVGKSSRFGEDPVNSLEISSLHLAVAPDRVNIHIDHTGFVIVGPNGELIVDPDFGQHIVNELLWKTDAKKKLPAWLVDNTSFVLPNSANDYTRVGISADLMSRKNYHVTVTGTCTIRGEFDCSATLGVSGKFGGKKW